jgi:hypothetical protein
MILAPASGVQRTRQLMAVRGAVVTPMAAIRPTAPSQMISRLVSPGGAGQ